MNPEEKYLRDNLPNLLNLEKSQNLAELLDGIKKYVESYKNAITTSQLRNIFARVKKADNHLSLQLLRPRLAYVAARQGKQEAREMVEFFEYVISNVKNNEQTSGFKAFFESVVAYHKYFNPKN